MDSDSEHYENRLLLENEEHLHYQQVAPDKREAGSNYEEAIAAVGYGKFHYLLLALCGWALSSDAIEIMSVSFVLPSATDDLQLSSADKGWLTSSIFAGMMIGGYLWGILADIHGRQHTLVVSLAVNSLAGLGSSLAQSFWLFLLLRIISGIGVGGSMPVIFSYYTEFQPKEKRGHMISLLATFWMTGNIIAAGLAWIIIPYEGLGFFTDTFTYNSWRIFLSICVLPALTSSLIFAVMPESPKYLMMKGEETKSLQVLQQIYQQNNPTKNVHSDFQIKHLEMEHLDSASERRLDSRWARMKSTLKISLGNVSELFQQPLTATSAIMTTIFFTLSFGYYGLFMWFPELFNRMEKYGGSPCNLGKLPLHNDSDINHGVSNNIYLETFLTSLSNLPGNILTFFIIDKVGRKSLLSSSMVLSGVSVFFITLLHSKTHSVIMSCVFGGISVIGWNALDVIGVELYPTKLRTTANGVLMGVGRIAAILGNVVFGQLVDVNCMIPMVMVSSLLCLGGLISLKLPNSQSIDLG